MTEIGRIFGVFYEPGKVFADLAQKPRWIVPVLIMILVGCGFVYVINTHVGWDQIVRQSIARNPRTADMPADQKEVAIQRGAKFASVIGWVGAIVGPPFFILVIAGVLTGLFNALLGTDLRFSQMFSITAYAMLVRSLFSILFTLIIYLKPPEDVDIQTSPFSAAILLSRQDSPKWLYALASSMDLFAIWVVILLAVGFSTAARKLSFSKALIGVVIPWLFVVAVSVGLQSL